MNAKPGRSRQPNEAQCARTVLMVRPATFCANPETLATNAFQHVVKASAGAMLRAAQAEFDAAAEALAAADHVPHAIKDHAGQVLRGGVATGEGRYLNQIAVVDIRKQRAQGLGGEADIHDQAIAVQILAAKGYVDHIGGAMQPLRGTEDFSLETVGDHHVIANPERVHVTSPS